MLRNLAKSLKSLRINDFAWKRAAAAFGMLTLIATTGGCLSNGSDPLSPLPIGGGDPQAIPASRAILQSPSWGSRLSRATTFTWNSATDVESYTLEFHGSDDGQDLLASFAPGRSTSYTVQVDQLEKRPVLWVKLTTHHLDGQSSEPYWCEFWYPAEDQGWILDHFEYTVLERWSHGSGGQRVLEEDRNVPRSTRQFTAQPLDRVWQGGNYHVEETLRIDELPDYVPAGGQAAVRASATASISTSGLGFSRAAALGLTVPGGTDIASEPAAENRSVSLQAAVGPSAVIVTERMYFEVDAGLQSVNESHLQIKVVAVYRRSVG